MNRAKLYNEYLDEETENNNIEEDFIDPIIKSSLEYYDRHQLKIQKILNKIENIKFFGDKMTADKIIFYDANGSIILESRYEILSIFLPQDSIWKWSWAIPTAQKKNTIITRKILDYAFTLDSDKNYLLKSALINSKIKIINDLQLDIHITLSAYLSKQPFIFKFYIAPVENEEKHQYYPYKEIINKPNKQQFIVAYIFIIDYKS